MLRVTICEKFGWTFDEYDSQPQFFLDLIIERMKIDTQRSKNEIKNINKK